MRRRRRAGGRVAPLVEEWKWKRKGQSRVVGDNAKGTIMANCVKAGSDVIQSRQQSETLFLVLHVCRLTSTTICFFSSLYCATTCLGPRVSYLCIFPLMGLPFPLIYIQCHSLFSPHIILSIFFFPNLCVYIYIRVITQSRKKLATTIKNLQPL